MAKTPEKKKSPGRPKRAVQATKCSKACEGLEILQKAVNALLRKQDALELRMAEYEKAPPTLEIDRAAVNEAIEVLHAEAKKRGPAKVHRVETFNGEEPLEPRERSAWEMDANDMLRSMKNADAILPPNYRDDKGRHTIENIQALVGFKVTEEMHDALYAE